jgi:hypothetical protein
MIDAETMARSNAAYWATRWNEIHLQDGCYRFDGRERSRCLCV